MALDFVASGDKLTTAAFVVPTATTYTAWIKDPDFTSSTGPRIFENAQPTTRWFLDFTNSEFVFQRLYANTAEWRAPFPVGIDWTQWHHIAVSHDASSVNNDPVFYVDGEVLTGVVEDVTPTGSVNTTSTIMTIGNRGTNARQCGTLDWVCMHSAVLNQTQVQEAMDEGACATSQFAVWQLDPDGATFTDLSGNGRTATKVGTPTFLSGPTLGEEPGIEADLTSTFAFLATPRLHLFPGALFAFTSSFDVTVEEGVSYPGGPGAGVGGISKGRLAVMRRRRRH